MPAMCSFSRRRPVPIQAEGIGKDEHNPAQTSGGDVRLFLYRLAGNGYDLNHETNQNHR